MSNGTEIVYNKEKISHGVEELKQCQKELYEADVLFYKGIMALAAAKGIDLIINEDAAINLYMPEKIVIECREEIGRLLDEITTKVALVETLNDEPKEGSSEKIQLRKTEEIIENGKGSTSNDMQALYAPPGLTSGSGTCVGDSQALYAPPSLNPGSPSIQPMYGVITPKPIEGAIDTPVVQPMYGVITPNQPIEIPIQNPIETPVVQPMYGVITPTPPVVTPIEPPTMQPMYGVITPTPPVVTPIEPPTMQPMYGVITPTPPVVTPIEPPTMQPMYGVITPNVELPNPELNIVKEYETIPNTGIPGVIEQNYVSKHPKLIGGLAATMGIFGIPTILSDDFDEEEEKRINES